MPIPYIPAATTKRFKVPRTLAADFDRFLDQDIPNTVMDFEILKNWFDKFEDGYEPRYVRGEIYPDSTKSRYENTDNNLNIRCSVTSGIRKGDMLIQPDGTIFLLDWAVALQSNNAPSRAVRCNMNLTVFRYKNATVDEDGYLIDDEGFVVSGEKYSQNVKPLTDVIVDNLPANAFRYDGRPEYYAVSGSPGIAPNALTIVNVQFNDQTQNIAVSDRFIWGDECYEIVDKNINGLDISGSYGTITLRAKKAAGGIL